MSVKDDLALIAEAIEDASMPLADAHAALDRVRDALTEMEKRQERAIYLGEHLLPMIPQDVWCATGYHAEQVGLELREMREALAAARSGRET